MNQCPAGLASTSDGVPLHIVQRGHNREPCFFAEEDYSSYLHWLGEALAEFDAALHAYVLMTNHVHLLLTPRKAESIPKLIISLRRRYVQYVNRSYRRTGTAATSPPWCRPRPTCLPASATSSSIQCVRPWSKTRRTIAGPATDPTS